MGIFDRLRRQPQEKKQQFSFVEPKLVQTGQVEGKVKVYPTRAELDRQNQERLAEIARQNAAREANRGPIGVDHSQDPIQDVSDLARAVRQHEIDPGAARIIANNKGWTGSPTLERAIRETAFGKEGK